MSGATIAFVFFLGVFGSGKTLECVKDVLEDLGVDVTSPEEVEVFVVRDLCGHRLGWQFAKHHLDVYEGVDASVDKDNGRLDVAGGVLGDLGVLAAGGEHKRALHIVIVHLERLGTNNLEPVDDRLRACERVKMGICGKLLRCADMLGLPVEEKAESHVDELGEDGRVEDGLPHGCRAKN